MKNRKHLLLLTVAAGLLTVFTFQNCSQSQFHSASDLAQVSAKTFSELTKPELIQLEKGEIILCPMVMCEAPPPNCYYDNSKNTSPSAKFSSTTASGEPQIVRACNRGCGTLVCQSESISAPSPEVPVVKETDFQHLDHGNGVEVPACTKKLCAAPPVGCRFSSEPVLQDANGCDIGCSSFVCDGGKNTQPREIPQPQQVSTPAVAAAPAPRVCPKVVCSNAPTGCYYKGTPNVVDGCTMGCGDLVCENIAPAVDENGLPILVGGGKNISCPDVGYICPLPSSNCYYDSSNSTDAKGCSTGCGRLICKKD